MAERKDRMALLSRYNKFYTQRYERKSNINLNVEQWAADGLVESYGISQCYDLLEYYFSIAQDQALVYGKYLKDGVDIVAVNGPSFIKTVDYAKLVDELY